MELKSYFIDNLYKGTFEFDSPINGEIEFRMRGERIQDLSLEYENTIFHVDLSNYRHKNITVFLNNEGKRIFLMRLYVTNKKETYYESVKTNANLKYYEEALYHEILEVFGYVES